MSGPAQPQQAPQQHPPSYENIDHLKKSFLGVVQLAQSIAEKSGNENQPNQLKQLGGQLEEVHSICDKMYAHIYRVKQDIIFQELLGKRQRELRQAESGEEYRKTRKDILESIASQQQELDGLRQFLRNPPSVFDEEIN